MKKKDHDSIQFGFDLIKLSSNDLSKATQLMSKEFAKDIKGHVPLDDVQEMTKEYVARRLRHTTHIQKKIELLDFIDKQEKAKKPKNYQSLPIDI